MSNLATVETCNVWLWFFTIFHQVGPLTPETFFTLACLKISSTSMFSILANCCSSIKMWSGKPLTKAILTVFLRLCPMYVTNPASRLISSVYTSTDSLVQVTFLSLLLASKTLSENAVFSLFLILSASAWSFSPISR